jgi:hypothetical protein
MGAFRENLRNLASPLDEFKARDSKYLPHGNGRHFLIEHLACFKYGHHVVVSYGIKGSGVYRGNVQKHRRLRYRAGQSIDNSLTL